MTPVLIPGAIYRSTTHGLCEYKRVDTYMGQRTLEFASLKYGTFNVLPEALDRHFGPTQETSLTPTEEESLRERSDLMHRPAEY